MAKKAYIGVDGIARKIKKGYIGIKTSLMNVATPITGASGEATVESNKVVFRYTEHKDSYFFININQTLLTGNYYTVSFDCAGIDDETHLTILVDNKSENAMLLKNGRMSCTFKPNRDISDRLLMDDLADWANVIGKEIVLSNFAVEEYGTSAVARKIKKAYIGIGGVARPCWSGGELTYYGAITDLSAGNRGLAATNVSDPYGTLYALFVSSNVIDAYDTSLTKSNPTAPSNHRTDLAATAVGYYALFAGGGSTSVKLANVDAYSRTLTKTVANNLSVSRNYMAATTIGSYALFSGGLDSTNSSVTTVDAYNTSLTKSTPTELSANRQELAATAIGDYALFAGGRVQSTTLSNVVDAYNRSLTRSIPTILTAKKRNLAATTVGNYALFGGGSTGSDVVAYDKSLTRSVPTFLSVGRQFLTATTIGKYALFGGGREIIAGSPPSATMDVYDESLTRTNIQELSVARFSLAATTVGNYALFGGGGTANTTLTTVDAYVYSA